MKSSLYELNVLARRLAIEPVWFFPFEPNAEGYFEVSLQFGNLVVTELGKRKQDVLERYFVFIHSKYRRRKKLLL